jgi:sigma-E factor negative regulatory protein RseA
MVMNEDLSRLMDGDLDDAELDHLGADLRRPQALATWACYHAIGDTLRGCPHGTSGFGARFAAALAAEPTVLAPRPKVRAERPAMRWAVAAAATVAAVGVVGWTAFSLTESPGTAIAKAREASGITSAQVRPQGVPQDYVLVHQEYSPATALQGVQPYLRAVSAQGSDARP